MRQYWHGAQFRRWMKKPAARWLALRSAIFELDAENRQLILLQLEGLSLAEIEEVSGIRAGTVATRLSRLRNQLSERLRGKEARP